MYVMKHIVSYADSIRMTIKTFIDMITVYMYTAQKGRVDTLLADVHNKYIKCNKGPELVNIVIIISVVLICWTRICKQLYIIHN